MKVVAFAGPSGVGKTTLLEGVVREFKLRGQRVSVIKHAHKRFDIDQPGKDTWRHRQAGATEVLIASAHRLALMREYEVEGLPTVHQLIAELAEVDWVLIEGFKHADVLKIEVWRAGFAEAAIYPEDPFVVAIATDDPAALPQPTARPVLAMSDPAAVVSHLLDTADRHVYRPA